MVTTLPAGTRLYRVRGPIPTKTFGVLDLGAPPPQVAIQTNRMSPAGVVMTYVSETAATALAETAGSNHTSACSWVVGKFALTTDLAVLDLSKVPPVPSIFDLERSRDCDVLIFLRQFAKEVSRPIARAHSFSGHASCFHLLPLPSRS